MPGSELYELNTKFEKFAQFAAQLCLPISKTYLTYPKPRGWHQREFGFPSRCCRNRG
jgi:hypothetical protein